MNGAQFESINSETQVSAVILDLDGTLLNTEQLTKDVLKEFLKRYGKVEDKQQEDKRLGMTHKESRVGVIKDYDLPITPEQFTQEIMPMYQEKWPQAKALPGASRLIKHLHKHQVPFALASNSMTKNIESKVSHQEGWKSYFSVILGSDQVKSGKPSPDIFLEAAYRMGVNASRCLVIEDSLIGVKAGKAAGMKVVAVPSLPSASGQFSIADLVLHSLLEFQPELWGLPPFEDWVNNCLPVETMHFKGLCRNGLFHDVADDGISALPDQVSGVYFGWAKVDSQKILKVLVSIKWDHGCCSSKRIIQARLVYESDEEISDQWMQILLVGYIRRHSSKGKNEILEEDKLIASASLDLPAFTHHSCIPFFSEVAFEDECSL